MRIVVIGAGVGGMSAALRLARVGHDVTVVEQNARVGGKLNVWEPDVPSVGRFRFDTGPHVLTMPWAIRELFDDLGERMEDHLDLVRMDPICRYHFPGGDTFDAPASPDEAVRRIQAQFSGDEDGFRALLAYARRVHDVTVDPFLRQDFSHAVKGIPTPAQWRQLGQFLGLAPWKTLRQRVRQHIRHPRLQQIFDLYAFYNGSSPKQASGIFSIIAWEQWGDGTFYLRGGLRTYADALKRLSEQRGVTLRLETPIKSVSVGGTPGEGTVSGVQLASGECLPADIVICNADPITAYESLIPAAHVPRSFAPAKRRQLRPSTSAYVLLLGVRGTPEKDFPTLAHFNSFLTENLEREITDVFAREVPSDDPVIGITCQSVTEPGVAPPGYSTLFIMTSPPPLGASSTLR